VKFWPSQSKFNGNRTESKWAQIGEMGPMVMSLAEALKYIPRDPMGVFWG